MWLLHFFTHASLYTGDESSCWMSLLSLAQAISTILLTLITAQYTWSTRKISKDGHRAADAAIQQAAQSERAVRQAVDLMTLTQKQLILTQQPLIAPAIDGHTVLTEKVDRISYPDIITISITNYGSGIAIGIEATVEVGLESGERMEFVGTTEDRSIAPQGKSHIRISIGSPSLRQQWTSDRSVTATLGIGYRDIYGNRWRCDTEVTIALDGTVTALSTQIASSVGPIGESIGKLPA